MEGGIPVEIAVPCRSAEQVLFIVTSVHCPIEKKFQETLPCRGNNDSANMMLFHRFLEAQQLLHHWNQK